MKKPINKITRDNIAEFTTKRDQNPTFNTIDLYQRTATKSAFYPGQGSPLGLTYVALKMNGEAGEFAEHVGKAMRDDNLMEPGEYTLDGMNFPIVHASEALTEERRALIIKEMGDVLWYLSAACNELNMRLSEVALINLEKLCDRGERDAMQGSGDDR